MNIALSKGKELPPFKLAFSQKTFQNLQSFLSTYENAILFYRQSYTMQTKKNKEYSVSLKKAKMYISHFIQVMNMAILRGDLQPAIRKYFGIDADETKTPSLSTEGDVIEWGSRLIDGEAKRVIEGNTPVTNPTIALVRVRYETFMDRHHHQKTLQKNTARALENLTELRNEADRIILRIWNEVEDSFKDLPGDLMREKAKEYGLVYVYRKNEIGSINFFGNSKTGAG
ncbi:MAG: hypothetical protein EA408_08745 [Marinilabiliales bacterium]|nr:MAG: hypothetical protein EA408_08745 [Marinilabiliales bacterium]